MSKAVKAGGKGPSEFITHPDESKPQRLLWHEFDWPWKDPVEVQHPGLATEAEPQREHKRSMKALPRDFNLGTKWSERNVEPSEYGSRDGFSGSLPYLEPPKDEKHWQSTTPMPETPAPMTVNPIEGDVLRKHHPHGHNKLPGFFPWETPPGYDPSENLPHPSPPIFAGDEPTTGEEGPPSSYPGPGRKSPGGLDRVPAADFNVRNKPAGFYPVHLPDPNRNMFEAAIEPTGTKPFYIQRTGKGFDKSREDFDYDKTGKKAGFIDETLPKEHLTKAGRTMEDYYDMDAVFPKEAIPKPDPEAPGAPPTMRHRNERHVPPNVMKADNDMLQKQSQQLIPNMKMAIAIDPNGVGGDRIVIMSPLFQDTSPAIQALRSHRFEKHGALVVDGPPEWLMSMEVLLKAMDKNSLHSNPKQLLDSVLRLSQQRGLNVEYTQEPKV